MKITSILEDLESKIAPVVKKLSKMDERKQQRLLHILDAKTMEQAVRNANALDPTDQKAVYTYWIVKTLPSSAMRLPEDAERIQTSLALFDRLKKGKRFQDEKDINRYKSINELEKTVTKYGSLDKKADSQPTSIRQWHKWIKKQGSKVVYEDELFKVLKFELTGKTIEVVPAKETALGELQNWVPSWAEPEVANKKDLDIAAVAIAGLAHGTRLCVANPATAQDVYLKKGPLYAIFLKDDHARHNEFANGFYILATHDFREIMDPGNEALKRINENGDNAVSLGTSLFLIEFMVALKDELPPKAIKKLANFINPKLEKFRPREYRAFQNLVAKCEKSPEDLLV